MTCRPSYASIPHRYPAHRGARTALYCWLEARRQGGQFILRIEDTDRERSTQAAIDAILEAMDWLGLDYDEGPIFQTQRLHRYRVVAEQMVAAGTAYYAYETKQQLEAMREAAMAANEKPRYNGAYRERNDPAFDTEHHDDPNRVIRFKNPLDGVVVIDDKVKGRIEIANSDSTICDLRSDATDLQLAVVSTTSTYHSDVVRGDDHVTHALQITSTARWRPVPHFGICRLSLTRRRQVSKRTVRPVMQYRDNASAHALLNYLVRRAWSHGDQEISGRAK